MDTLSPLILAEGGGLLEQELSVVILLTIAAAVAILIRYIKVPYTVALVLVGLLLSFFPNFLNLTVSSDLILAVLVPPLLFEATLHIPWKKLRADLTPILMLAFIGTLIGTFLVGAIVNLVLGISWLAAIAFGALISATDPVAVIAFFRSMGVSKRLAVLVEGESLFNDGVAIVLFNLALAGTVAGAAPITFGGAIGNFLVVGLGGLLVGGVLGYVVSFVVLKNLDDHLIETAVSVALAFGSYTVAEEFGYIIGLPDLHFSGILAVVAAGLLVGNIGRQNTSPTTRLSLDNFWEFLAFVVNSFVFLLIGLEIEISQLWPNLGPIFLAIIAILLSRAIVVYNLVAVFNRYINPRRAIPMAYRHVMYWGGLRGAISLALALALAGRLENSDAATTLKVMTFGVVLFTLLGQGTTMETLIRRLKLAEKPEQRLEQQRRQARLYAKQAGKRELDRLREQGILFKDIWQAMGQVYEEEIVATKDQLRTHLEEYPELQQEMYLQAREDALRAERSAIGDAARRGLISQEVLEDLTREFNDRAAALEILQENRGLDAELDEGEENIIP